jgi:hypothetical protein
VLYAGMSALLYATFALDLAPVAAVARIRRQGPVDHDGSGEGGIRTLEAV